MSLANLTDTILPTDDTEVQAASETYDVEFTTASFFFNIALSLTVFILIMLFFLIYRKLRKDSKTIRNKIYSSDTAILEKYKLSESALGKINWLQILYHIDEDDLLEL